MAVITAVNVTIKPVILCFTWSRSDSLPCLDSVNFSNYSKLHNAFIGQKACISTLMMNACPHKPQQMLDLLDFSK